MCVCVYAMCVFFRRGMSDSSAVASYSLLSLSLPLFRFLSVLPFPLAQRFLRAALIFAARGHYQLIDYFDCYLIPPSVGIRGAYVQAESLALSLRQGALPCSPSFAYAPLAAGSQTVRYLPINLLQAGAVGTLAETTVAHLVLRASVSHFLPPALTVRASATVLKLYRPEGWLHL